MRTLQSLEFIRIVPRRFGIFAFAKYPDWQHEYVFFISARNKVLGQTTDGVWLETGEELSGMVREEISYILSQESDRIYA